MFTYQDLLQIGDDEQKKIAFVYSVIADHKRSELYQTAVIADEYDSRKNRTIMTYQKLLYTISGEAVPDNYSANYKLCSNFFSRFVTQQNQFLLSNGVTWQNETTEAILGEDFDYQLQKIARDALVGGVAFGFWNLDHIEGFSVNEFAPLWDEENGALMAGVRFWQIDTAKPLRATLYEFDGYTDYIWNTMERSDKQQGVVLREKRPYKINVGISEADGTEIYDGENYPGFPIVPLWGNPHKQSEIVGMRENIDAFDLIKSGFANDLDDCSQIFWTIQNATGMDDIDLAKFVERMKTVKAAVIDEDGAKAESHTIDVPYAAREAILTRLRNDMFEDFMALDTQNISAGATTATQIKAAYEPLNAKADQYEFCVLQFVESVLKLAGVEDKPTFTRSMIVNTQENIQVILQSAQYLSEDYVTEKILNLLGDGDKADEVLQELHREAMETTDFDTEEQSNKTDTETQDDDDNLE